MKPTAQQIRRYVEDRFRGQRIGSTRELKLLCPFHADKVPSLSFNLERGVWTCFAGCGDGGLIDFEQKLHGGTRDDARARVEEIMGADHLFESQRTKPVAIYQYRDAQGRVVFEKLRYEPKRFVQRRPDGKGGFEYKLGNIQKPLYRLPELITANVALICEGEKDADRVASLKLGDRDPDTRVAATTNFDGAGKWREDYGIYFAGKRVVILPDNDDAGRQHAEIVARNVSRYAAGVRIVELPGLPEKGDVSDFLEKHTADDLIAEIKRAPAWKPIQQTHRRVVEGTRFVTSSPAEVDWALEGVIERGSNGVIVGEPKAGKSLAIVDLMIAIATGTPWLGFAVPRRMKCALISREDYPGMTARRIGSLFRGSERRIDFEGWTWINTRAQTPSFLLEDEVEVSAMIQELKDEQIEFCCLDVFRRLHMADENDNTEMSKILATLTKIQQEVGCALALVHHANRDIGGSIFRRVRGASAIHGWMEWGIGVTISNPEEPPRDWVRKAEFECKSACAANPRFFQIQGTDDAMRLVVTEAPTHAAPRPMRSAARFMESGA